MATAEYETTTRTVAETLVVLKLTEDEADELREVVEEADGTRTMVSIMRALQRPATPKADTYDYGGITYDLTASYTDRDGDSWAFSPSHLDEDEVPRGRFRNRADFETHYNLKRVIDAFGPLTKVTQ
ncbi:phiSA1p31-related protein [Streptomyces sp. NPDC003027]